MLRGCCELRATMRPRLRERGRMCALFCVAGHAAGGDEGALLRLETRSVVFFHRRVDYAEGDCLRQSGALAGTISVPLSPTEGSCLEGLPYPWSRLQGWVWLVCMRGMLPSPPQLGLHPPKPQMLLSHLNGKDAGREARGGRFHSAAPLRALVADSRP